MDFPGGTVDKNLSASPGDTGSIPSPGRFHKPRSNQAHEPQLLEPLHCRAHKLQLLKLIILRACGSTNKRSHCNEKPMRCNKRVVPARESLCAAAKAQHNQNRELHEQGWKERVYAGESLCGFTETSPMT